MAIGRVSFCEWVSGKSGRGNYDGDGQVAKLSPTAGRRAVAARELECGGGTPPELPGEDACPTAFSAGKTERAG
jgi:hypothetical protein